NKNAPALTFLDAVAAPFKQAAGNDLVFAIPATHANAISESRILETAQAAADAVKEQQAAPKPSTTFYAPSALIQEIATRFNDAQAIAEAIRTRKTPAPPAATIQSELTPQEQAVADVWREVLGISEVTPSSDFFALGGDSLLATQVISRLRQISKVRLHLHDIFENTTVAALAASLEKSPIKTTRQTPATRTERN